ncbi:hypothetical protein EVAR_77953_1 [Eumeta japonica]|uniref:Reverse transcriptase domain-containing protein n=1 Tax=Eumeta variegata TaxID=151549 RepID=A0A4C1XVZ8_EUMVA|nr:hypothetical protein EVAR_77953_1 [Eumeta japonica]
MTAQTIRNLKLAPQRVERATVATCSHLTDIAENLIYDAAAQPAPNQSTSERLWYLPHFAVTHPQKKKVRLVFDAAARTERQMSERCIAHGPRFNKITIGCTRPIQTGPRSVSTSRKCSCGLNQKEDRDSLRFLWRNNMHENPQEYRMTSLIFGAASSRTAIYIKNRNASEFELEYPEACKAIRLDHYVDDFLKSFNSIEEARRVSKQVYEIHRGSLRVTRWASNKLKS